LSEKELIELLKKGDRDAFNVLIEQYQSKVINIAYGLLSDREDALDASQEVFVKIFRSIEGFKENSSLSTWIYRITANICKDYLRKRMRTAKTVSIDNTDDEDNEIYTLPDTGDTPEQAAEKTEIRREISEAIKSMSDDYKKVIILCDIEGLSYDDAAKILKCPTGTVKSRLNRARQNLRKKITELREQK